MIELGFHLSSEELSVPELIKAAQLCEESGFSYATISDHFHPWTQHQGQSPFVWGVIGAISQVTRRLRLGTAVTCPLVRIHPAIIAQAAATSAILMNGRFFLGLGTGENLNEHVTGQEWPDAQTRWAMLEEAIEVIRLLWSGDVQNHLGHFYRVQDARLFSLPEKPPELYVAANAVKSAEIAGSLADGLIAVAAKKEIVEAFERAGGKDKTKIGNVTVCYAPSEAEARRIAFETWPTTGLESKPHWELRTPQDFEQAVRSEHVTEEKVAEKIVCGPNLEDHVQAIQKYIDTGFTHVGIKQCGHDFEGFFRFYRDQVLPRLKDQKLVESLR